MKTQPEALRLANELDAIPETGADPDLIQEAAAELRRLHKENERLHQINHSHEMKLSVRGYEIQIADLEAQRDALLEALKLIQHATSPTPNDGGHHEAAHDISTAAIKAVEGEKK